MNSIDSFKKSDLKAKEYILVHNRIGKDKSFREPIENKLRTLEMSGQVKKAKLWSAQKLLQVVFNAFQERCLAEIKRSNINNFKSFQDLEQIRWEPLDKVPLQTSVLLSYFRGVTTTLISISVPQCLQINGSLPVLSRYRSL